MRVSEQPQVDVDRVAEPGLRSEDLGALATPAVVEVRTRGNAARDRVDGTDVAPSIRDTAHQDLNDTSRCRVGCVGVRREACEAEEDTLGVRTLGCPRFGIMCLAMSAVWEQYRAPTGYGGTAVRLVVQNCKHLGIDCDDVMDALLPDHRLSRSSGPEQPR